MTDATSGIPELFLVLTRMGVAFLLGAAIGFERQWNQKTAGLRTNALVAVGACGFVLFGVLLDQSPTLIAGQIVTGIGFLGAGVILREGTSVTGLNTAATLWCSAMVGAFAGGGMLAASLIAACFVMVTNFLLRPLVQRLNMRFLTATNVETQYRVEVTSVGAQEAHVRLVLMQALSQAGLGLRRLESEDIPDTSKVSVVAQAVSAKRNDAAMEQIVGRLSLETYVSAATWQIDRSSSDI
jgi:putative Mg2+ transporter-C (MgtC) family protein